jgi:integrase
MVVMVSIRKRVWISRGNEKSAWVVDYCDQMGKRRLKTFATRKEADAWSVTARHEIRQGTHTAASSSITVARGSELWLEQCEADGLEESTIRQRRQHISLHINPFLGQTKLSDLTAPRVHTFDGELRSTGRSLAMRKKIISSLKTMLAFCQQRGHVAQNVARAVRIGTNADHRHEGKGPLRAGVNFPSRAELKALMQAASGRWRPLLITAMFTGMRASELRGLPWSNVDLEAGAIHVRQRADAWGKIGKPKSKAGARDIPLPPIVVSALMLWNQTCPTGDLNLVFPNGRGNVESLANIWNRFWSPLQIKCGVSIDRGKRDHADKPIIEAKYGFHMLRHAAASLFIQHLGWTPKRVQIVMGHSTINTTFDLYGHLFDDLAADREDMKKIEAAITAA